MSVEQIGKACVEAICCLLGWSCHSLLKHFVIGPLIAIITITIIDSEIILMKNALVVER